MDNIFFNKELGYGGILQVGRFAVHSQRGFLVEVAILFGLCAVGVLALKRGEFGRRLAAVNDSEVACAALGLNVTGTKVIAFTLAAGIAGLGGALYGGWQRVVSPQDFFFLFSLIVLVLIAIGGLGTVAGAFIAALAYALQPVIQTHTSIPNFAPLLFGIGAATMGRNPGGLAGYMADAGDWIRARRAQAPPRDERVPEEVSVRVAG